MQWWCDDNDGAYNGDADDGAYTSDAAHALIAFKAPLVTRCCIITTRYSLLHHHHSLLAAASSPAQLGNVLQL